jgi:hypothetical protein
MSIMEPWLISTSIRQDLSSAVAASTRQKLERLILMELMSNKWMMMATRSSSIPQLIPSSTRAQRELNKNIAGVQGNKDEEEMEDFVARAEGDEILIGTTLNTELNENIAEVQRNEAGIEGQFVAQAEGNEILIGTQPEIELSQYIIKCTKI